MRVHPHRKLGSRSLYAVASDAGSRQAPIGRQTDSSSLATVQDDSDTGGASRMAYGRGVIPWLTAIHRDSIESLGGRIFGRWKDSHMPITINGNEMTLPRDPRVSLLDFLREDLHLTGSKKGCNQGACGACTVLVDGERALSCLALAVQCEGRVVTTIEGLASASAMHPLQKAFIEHDGFQCGYCTPGQICSAVGMVDELRRCGAYNGIVDAILEVHSVGASAAEILTTVPAGRAA